MLAGIEVVGARSGLHAGTVRQLRRGRGAVFRPERRFEPGELVTVRRVPAVHGARGDGYSFFTAERGAPGSARPELRTIGRGRLCNDRRPRLRTIPGVRPPGICVLRRPRVDGGRHLFIAPRTPNAARGVKPSLMILSPRGRLLWYAPQPTVNHDFKRITHEGRPMLVRYVRRKGSSDYAELLDEHYNVVRRVRPGNRFHLNAHEVEPTSEDTLLLGSYTPVVERGSGRSVIDFVAQEVDPVTGDVLFEWHALDHVPLSASFSRPRDPHSAWDYFHGNSIEAPPVGGRTLLVSARKTSAVYGIDHRTGDVRWILGGKQDQFGLATRHRAWRFCAQHDARWLRKGELTLFDNGGTWQEAGSACPRHPARAMRFRIDGVRRRVQLLQSVPSQSSSDDRRGHFPGAVGSARWQPNGDALVDWGNSGRITQVSRRGTVRLALQLEYWTYRAVREYWRGSPDGRPTIAIRPRAGPVVDVFASWNGATRIRRWQVLAGPTEESLQPLGHTHRWADLETRMRVRTESSLLAVEALDRRGRVLGRSLPVRRL